MPTTRFLKYVSYMNKCFDEANKTPHQKKVDKLKSTLTPEELKEMYG
jgi:hypothetical protein